MNSLHVSTKNLKNRPLRSSFTILAIGMATAAFLCFIGLSRGIEKAWTEALVKRNTHIVGTPKGAVDVLNGSIDQSVVAEMAKTRGIVGASGEMLDLIGTDDGQMILAVGWPLGGFLWRSMRLEKGELPSTTTLNPVVLGHNTSIALALDVGDRLLLRGRSFTVVGISKEGDPIRNNAVIMPLKVLQTLTNRHGKVGIVNFQLAHPYDKGKVDQIMSLLSAKFPDFAFVRTEQVANSNKIVRVFRAMAWGVSTIALFIAVIVILNTLLLSVLERTKDIAILNAMGWSARRILSMVLTEGLMLAGAGGCVGVVLGILGVKWLNTCEQLRGLIYPRIDTVLLIEVALATAILGLFGSLYPAMRAVALEPATALRHE